MDLVVFIWIIVCCSFICHRALYSIPKVGFISGVGLESSFLRTWTRTWMSMTRTWTLGSRLKNCPSPARVQFFSIVLYLPQSELILVLSLKNDDLRHTASFWVGMFRWENKNWPVYLPNCNPKLDPCISRRSKITF